MRQRLYKKTRGVQKLPTKNKVVVLLRMLQKKHCIMLGNIVIAVTRTTIVHLLLQPWTSISDSCRFKPCILSQLLYYSWELRFLWTTFERPALRVQQLSHKFKINILCLNDIATYIYICKLFTINFWPLISVCELPTDIPSYFECFLNP